MWDIIVHCGKGSISTFQEFFARAGKILISGEGLTAMQQFYVGLRFS